MQTQHLKKCKLLKKLLKQDIERWNIIMNGELNIQDDLILGQVAYDIEQYVIRIVLGPFV